MQETVQKLAAQVAGQVAELTGWQPVTVGLVYEGGHVVEVSGDGLTLSDSSGFCWQMDSALAQNLEAALELSGDGEVVVEVESGAAAMRGAGSELAAVLTGLISQAGNLSQRQTQGAAWVALDTLLFNLSPEAFSELKRSREVLALEAGRLPVNASRLRQLPQELSPEAEAAFMAYFAQRYGLQGRVDDEELSELLYQFQQEYQG